MPFGYEHTDKDSNSHSSGQLHSQSIAELEALSQEAKKRCIGDTPHWTLELIGRDPSYKGCAVADRLIMPLVERARQDGHPVWLEASNMHACDVYLRLGFRVVEERKVGKGRCDELGNLVHGGQGVTVWAMVIY